VQVHRQVVIVVAVAVMKVRQVSPFLYATYLKKLLQKTYTLHFQG
jgi:hypothetical protein